MFDGEVLVLTQKQVLLLSQLRNSLSNKSSWRASTTSKPHKRNKKKKLWENSHVLPAPGVYPVVVNECLNVNTNSSISTINKENLPLQRRRKIVWFFSFGVVWLAGFYCLVFFPPGQWLPPWQTFSKSLAKQQQWLNFPWSALRSGLFCPIRNKFGVWEESQVFLSSLPLKPRGCHLPPPWMHQQQSHSSGGCNIPAAWVSPLMMFI